MITNVYVDGFNLYNRALKNTPHRWLDLSNLCKNILPDYTINQIKYYTAFVRPTKYDQGCRARQGFYLRALKTIPNLSIYSGQFMSHPVFRPLCDPPQPADGKQRRMIRVPVIDAQGERVVLELAPHDASIKPFYVPVMDMKEKGSDVNLASHMLFDAMNEKLDAVAVITNDSDLVEPLKIIHSKMGLEIIVIFPSRYNTSIDLKRVAQKTIELRPTVLSLSQFPETVTDTRGSFSRPVEWR